MHSPRYCTANNNYRSAHVQTLPKDVLYNYQMVNIHLIDGVYQGFVNSSYQRDGFGVILIEKYELYMGFFKFNKMHGIGLIVFDDGSIIYGHFNQGKLEGIVLTDNMGEMQIGTYQQEGMSLKQGLEDEQIQSICSYSGICNRADGACGQYTGNAQFRTLDPITFHSIQNPTIFSHPKIQKYRGDNLFFNLIKDVNNVYFHQLSPELQFYGAIIDAKYEGIGVLYNPTIKTVVQAGIYSQGVLHILRLKMMGKYVRGKKEGLFMQKTGDNIKFVDFVSQQRYNQTRQQNEITYKKYQRLYNFQQKDFLSIRHGVQFQKLKIMFESRDYKLWKLQFQKNKKQKQSISTKPTKPKIEKVRAPTSIVDVYAHEKPSLFVMQEKISDFKSRKKHQYASNPQKKNNANILAGDQSNQNDKGSKFDQYVEEAIAIQQNPLVSEPNSSQKIKFNFKRST